jgi:glycerol-3-phosphate dehydrogenase
VIKELR